RSCAGSAAATVNVGSSSTEISANQVLAHDATFTSSCNSVNSGYSGTIVGTCYLGTIVLNATDCHPSPCGTGSTVTVQLAELRSVHASQAWTAHEASYSTTCSAENSDFYGDFQVTCAYGELSADMSTCIENPCLNTSFVEVDVGGVLATRSPPSEVVHGSTWTAKCDEVNWDFAGDVQMWPG
ncbi:unnamed protein product, partial [Durusdinium trenchii]